MRCVNSGQRKAVGLVSDGGYWLEDVIIALRRAQGADATTAIAIDRGVQSSYVGDEFACCELGWTAVVIEVIGTAFDQ